MERDDASTPEAPHRAGASDLSGEPRSLKAVLAVRGDDAPALDQLVHLVVIDRDDRDLVGAQQPFGDRVREGQVVHDAPEQRVVVHRRQPDVLVRRAALVPRPVDGRAWP